MIDGPTNLIVQSEDFSEKEALKLQVLRYYPERKSDYWMIRMTDDEIKATGGSWWDCVRHWLRRRFK